MKSLIIGAGQIGDALYKIFSEAHQCYVRDIGSLKCEDVEVLHIAFPYSEGFIENVRAYIRQYRPSLTMIHSSVAVGTSLKCGEHVVHSPERGRHPNLVSEMRKFPKFIGGLNDADVAKAVDYVQLCDWFAIPCADPRWTELVKLLSNVHLGLEIAWRQEVDRIFSEMGAGDSDKQIYELWEDSYNLAHKALGQEQLIRPRLKPGPIGGHCIIPCTKILASQIPSVAFEMILKTNERTKNRKKGQESLS